MKGTKLFRWLWRFNAVVLAMGGLLAILVLLFTSYHVIRDVTRTRMARDIVNVEPNPSIDEEWHYGNLVEVCDTAYAVLPLETRQSYSLNVASGKEASSVRNLLFINAATSAKHWLLPDNTALILRHPFASYGTYGANDCLDSYGEMPTVGWYEIVRADTDKNGRLDSKDTTSVAISHIDGTQFTEIVSDADAIIGRPLVHSGRFMLCFERDGKTYLANVQTSDFRVVSLEEIPAGPVLK